MVAVAAAGFCTTRHVEALRSAYKHFAQDKLQKATIATGLTVSYAIHTNYDAQEPDRRELPEERIVMLMGFLQTKEQWAPLIDLLLEKWSASKPQKNVKILTFDNRGIGSTDMPLGRYTTNQMAMDTLALMDHVGWKSAHIVGLSMGGMISLELASTASERVQSLTLMVTTRGKYKQSARSYSLVLGSIFSRDGTTVINCMLELMYPNAFLEGTVQDRDGTVYDVLSRYHASRPARHPLPTLTGTIGQALAIKTHFVSNERLQAISKAGFPILIVGGLEDILIPPTESFRLKKHMDSSDHVQTLFFRNGGHGVHIQHMEEVVDGLMQTFRRSKL